jgi:uncharacterized protein YndB with AHSA1/START domain
MNDFVELETLIEAPIERVWEVLTDPVHFAAWYASGGAEIDLRPGGRMVMRWEEHGEFLAVVEAVERPTRFAYRFARQPGELPRAGNSTLAEFTLTPVPDGTLVRVTERGFEDLDLSADERNAYAEIEREGWQQGLAALRRRAGSDRR